MNTGKKHFFGILLLSILVGTYSTYGYANFILPSNYNHGSKIVEEENMLSKNKFYYQILPTPINHLMTGEIIAMPFQVVEPVVSARVVSGTLPPGTKLFPNGLVTVIDMDQLESGEYSCIIETLDNLQNNVKTEIAVTIKSTVSQSNREAVYKISPVQEIDLIMDEDVLAQAIDPDGKIVAALHVMGNLPPGSELTSQGKLIVKDRAQLVPNVYNVGIVTVDEQGSSTFFVITVPVKEGNRNKGTE